MLNLQLLFFQKSSSLRHVNFTCCILALRSPHLACVPLKMRTKYLDLCSMGTYLLLLKLETVYRRQEEDIFYTQH